LFLYLIGGKHNESRISLLATAFAALAMQAENPHFSPTPVNNKPIEDWKRKKCKSCKRINSCSVHLYRTKQNSQAGWKNRPKHRRWQSYYNRKLASIIKRKLIKSIVRSD